MKTGSRRAGGWSVLQCNPALIEPWRFACAGKHVCIGTERRSTEK